MAVSKNYLYELTRSQRFLWKMVLGVIALSLLVGWLLHVFFEETITFEDEGLPAVLDQLEIQSWGLHGLTMAENDPLSVVLEAELSAQEQAIAMAYWESLAAKEATSRPSKTLLELAAQQPLVRYANYAVASFWEYWDEDVKALESYLKEASLEEAQESRQRVVRLYVRLEAWSGLERVMNEPAYADVIEPWVRLKIAANNRDWLGILKGVVLSNLNRGELVYVLMASFSGLVWMVFLFRAGQISFGLNSPTVMMLVAFGLGVLSVLLTHLIIVVEESIFGLEQQPGLAGGLLYFIAGVGLREEFSKLVFFMPLVPFLLKHRDRPMWMLMGAGAVGLGFAAAENIAYYADYSITVAPGRFLTANFFHVSATGLCGYAFGRIFLNARTGLNDFFMTFAIVVLIHGLYNSLLSLPELAGFSLFAMSVYILMCYQFFHIMHEWRQVQREPISLTAYFLGALSLLLAMVLCFLTSQYGIARAIEMAAPSIMGAVIVVVMFIREIREPMYP